MREPRTWDIFCRVVDNLGDAGVCWRLARQLAAEHGINVRLWIDELDRLGLLHPAIDDEVERQTVEGVEVRRWPSTFADVAAARVVIEAFGCGLPDDYVSAMARESPSPLWIVLEYLSAEPWVPTHHALPSPHPRWPLARYFFFPGFVSGSGGLLREADLTARRDAFDAACRQAFWKSLGHEPPAAGAIAISLFAYESAPLADLLQCWQEGAREIVAAIPEGPLLDRVAQFLGVEALPAGTTQRRRRLEVRAVPFLPQARYDELLWACDCNFVRGEDSFVRAQWAARPFVWQIYPQEARAHWGKLDAFLALYTEQMPADAREAASGFMRQWNQINVAGVTPASAWEAYVEKLDVLGTHAPTWAVAIAGAGGLADNLVQLCRMKLKSG